MPEKVESKTVKSDDDIKKLQGQVREAFKCTWDKLLDVMKSDYMEGFHRLRFGQLGRRPLGNDSLTLQEQLTQTSHALATLAAAKRLWNKYPDCKGLELHLTTSGGRDIKSIRKDKEGVALVEAEVFATVDPNGSEKLKREITALTKCPKAKHRFVFFYCPPNLPCPIEPRKKQAEDGGVRIIRLGKAEVMGDCPTLAAEPASVDEARALRGIGWDGDLDAMRSNRAP